MSRSDGTRLGNGLLWAVLVTAVSGGASTARAQGVDFDIAFDQSFTSADGLASPMGLRAALGFPRLIGPIGVQVSYRWLFEQGGRVDQYCGLSSCTVGPFDERSALHTAGASFTHSSMLSKFLELTLGAGISRSWQIRSLELVPGDGTTAGDVTSSGSVENEAGPDLGLGVFGEIRFPRSPLGLRPILYVRYERIGGIAQECAADGSCLGGRDVASVGIGLSRRIP